MTILYFFSFRNSLKSWSDSGILNRELEIFKLLNNKYGYKFIFFTYGTNDENKYIDGLDYISLINYSNLFGVNKQIKILNTFLIPFKLKKNKLNFEIIQQNQLIGSWVSILTKVIFRKPLFIRTGYSMHAFSILENKSLFKIILYKLLTIVSIWLADIYTVSSDTELKGFNYKSKIRLLRNWSNSLSEKPFKSRYSNRIICVGRLVPQKNYTKLIKDFKNSAETFEIDIVGSGEEEEELKLLSKKLRVNVNFIGRIENSLLKTLYQNYKYFVNCSEFEGNPKSTIEAMGAGCVVLASKIDNHSELIDSYKNGILFDLKNSNIKEIINNLSEQQSQKISINAINTVNTLFKIEKILNQYNEIYKSLSK